MACCMQSCPAAQEAAALQNELHAEGVSPAAAAVAVNIKGDQKHEGRWSVIVPKHSTSRVGMYEPVLLMMYWSLSAKLTYRFLGNQE